MPKAYNELVLIVNKENKLPLSVMYALNIENKEKISEYIKKASNGEKVKLENVSYDFNKIIGKTYKLINSAETYEKVNGTWRSRSSDASYVKKLYDNGVELKITGIVKVKDNNIVNGYLGYTGDLTKYVMQEASKTEIVKQQLNNKEINVFTGLKFDEMLNESYDENLRILGYGSEEIPNEINIYPKDREAKAELKKFIENYNNSVSEENKIIYVDQMEELTKGVSSIVSMVSLVIIAFVAISLVVSSLMIGIITYISVLERTKEIGILRAIGASKKDVKRVFIAETIIEGFASGALGIAVTYALSLGVNVIVNKLAKVEGIMQLSVKHAIILIAISVLLNVIAGLRPAKIASKKEPVESLRAE